MKINDRTGDQGGTLTGHSSVTKPAAPGDAAIPVATGHQGVGKSQEPVTARPDFKPVVAGPTGVTVHVGKVAVARGPAISNPDLGFNNRG